ncbi:MAG: hypothetical protein OEW37_08615 [Rhodospirillaceae bacterium]|nr:hypothetical protein [Rhodospirillaceae bacterium]
MFGFSLTKLVFTIIAVAIVWHGFKLLSRKSDMQAEKKSSKTAKAKDDIEEMIKCESCGTFVAPGVKKCTRDDCPFPG